MCEKTNDAYTKAIEYLKTSPMFNLSLSSNELFHSNFLYWIWQVNKECFKKIINSLIGEENYWQTNWCGKELEVRREYKNFDLSIVEVQTTAEIKKENDKAVDNTASKSENESGNGDYNTDGLILFVLENKVKSIPYKEQLIKYNTKIDAHNTAVVNKENRVRKAELKKLINEEKEKLRNGGRLEKGVGQNIETDIENINPHLKSLGVPEPKKVLLSLVENFPDKPESPTDTLEGWNIKFYRDYITQIKELELADYDNLKTDYCNYVRHLIALVKQWENDKLSWKGKFLSWIKDNRCNLTLDIRTKEGKNKNYHIKDAEELRLHALYHKLNSIKLCAELERKIKGLELKSAKIQYIRAQDDKVLYGAEDKKNKKERTDYFKGDNMSDEKTFLIGLGYGYTHNEPIIEIKVVHNKIKEYFYIIQVQGQSYCHGIIGSEKLWEHKEKFARHWMRIDIATKTNEAADILQGEIFDGENILYPTTASYKKYGDHMIYQSRKIKVDVDSKDILDYMANDVRKLLEQLATED